MNRPQGGRFDVVIVGAGPAEMMAAIAADFLPRRLSRVSVLQQCTGCSARPKALPLTVVGVEGFERAMVTRGGVNLEKMNPRTLESKKVPGLFSAGEILDLDGPSGGYNLQSRSLIRWTGPCGPPTGPVASNAPANPGARPRADAGRPPASPAGQCASPLRRPAAP